MAKSWLISFWDKNPRIIKSIYIILYSLLLAQAFYLLHKYYTDPAGKQKKVLCISNINKLKKQTYELEAKRKKLQLELDDWRSENSFFREVDARSQFNMMNKNEHVYIVTPHKDEEHMKFTLPALPYAYDALEPYIDEETMEVHHKKHHQSYINNLNNAIEKHQILVGKTLQQLLKQIPSLPKDVQNTIRNNAGGHANHILFWNNMSSESSDISPNLFTALEKAFGSLEKFYDDFLKSATTHFGSGWVWLVYNIETKSLKIITTTNQDSPIMDGYIPLLALDVWEHAYYLKYQNRRADYVSAWFDLINWDCVSKRYEQAQRGNLFEIT